MALPTNSCEFLFRISDPRIPASSQLTISFVCDDENDDDMMTRHHWGWYNNVRRILPADSQAYPAIFLRSSCEASVS